MSSRPHSARERRVGTGTGKTNAIQPQPGVTPVLRQRPNSARERPNSAGQSSPAQSNNASSAFAYSNQYSGRSSSGGSFQHEHTREQEVEETMKTPFYSTLYATNEKKERRCFLPKSRFPTVPPIEPVPASRYRRPPIAPKWFTDNNQKQTMYDRADFRLDVDPVEKAELVDDFMSRNKYRMSLYNHSFKTKKPAEIREEMMNADRFLNQMTQHAFRERAYVSGTSSARMKSLIDQSHQNSMGEVKDPFLCTLRSTREQHNNKINTILESRQPYNSDFARGFNHTPGYGNFSNFNGMLKSNEQSVLKR
jgi:hypothetical protein